MRAASRRCAGGRDVYVVPMPAVVDGQGGPQSAALPVGARPAARQAQAAGRVDRRRGPSRGWRWSRLVLPPGSGKQVEILGNGPEAAPAVVGVLRELGVL